MRQHARKAGVALPVEVVEELALHLLDTYTRALDDGDSESVARERARQTLEAATMSDLAHRARRGSDTRLIDQGDGRTALLFGLWCDLRYALRLLRRSPGFSAAIIGVLALSIGATTAVWSVVHAVLLRPSRIRTRTNW